MGSVYDRGTANRPNVWITWREGGKKQFEQIGKAPLGLTKAAAKRRKRDLEQKARRRLAEIELGDGPRVDYPLIRDAGPKWASERTNRSADHDRTRMRKHVVPHLGHLRLDEVGTGELLAMMDNLSPHVSGATIGRVLAVLSRFYNEQRSRHFPRLVNPVSLLDKSDRKRARSTHDPSETPFLETKEQIRAVYHQLPEHMRPLFAVGAFGGLRKGEALALQWGDVDLKRRRITVRRNKLHGKHRTGPPKSGKARVVPINDTLLAVLKSWKVRCRPGLWCFPSAKWAEQARMMDNHTPNEALTEALAALQLPHVTWYQATRHTFASQWVMDGGSIEKLSKVLGHSSVLVTERYAHLRPDAFGGEDYATACVDLAEPAVLHLAVAEDGYDLVTIPDEAQGAAR